MPETIEYITAETKEGREAILQVMEQSFQADLEPVPAEWAIARVVDGIPVSFVLVDPTRLMQFPGRGLSFGFILDVGTRKDRRWEGHFRGIMEEVFRRLHTAGISLVGCHGRYQLYRRFGFDVFTHNCGIFITPELIEFRLGLEAPERSEAWVSVSNSHFVLADVLLVYRTHADSIEDARQVLLSAASLARQKRKSRILFEHPEAPSYGSTYPIYPTPETPLSEMARACGGSVVVQGANPEEGAVPDADWLKALDVPLLLQQVL
ncbi:MAG: GNAT family N-acetyltransferase, partial [Anaerolineaceae bacterium]|nr:GNAT family N-acetyltransferase [Anaerolineaceae bacterium]